MVNFPFGNIAGERAGKEFLQENYNQRGGNKMFKAPVDTSGKNANGNSEM